MHQQSDVERLREVQLAVRRAAVDGGRSPDDVTLVCVTKTIAADRIAAILAEGVRAFGENRVQEATEKYPQLRAAYRDLKLRLIGPLQTNKVREAIQTFDAIETVDRPRLAVEIAKEIQRAGRAPELFVQVNIGEEPQKAGIPPLESDDFIKQCRTDLGLAVSGLMCIPPVDQQASPYFALLARIAARNGISRLSMGMSSDYELAIQLGATEVRVGSAIFGAR